jgi:hypothetical protein
MDTYDLMQKSMDGAQLSRNELVHLLSMPPDSSDSYLVMAEANRVSKELTGNNIVINRREYMNKRSNLLLTTALVIMIVCAASAKAGDMTKTATLDGLRVELHVLPAEPFFTADEIAARQVKEGMLIMGGAKPIAPDATSHPNHHLVVHVYNAKTSKATTDAAVSMDFQLLDDKGKPNGAVVDVPVVVMQAIGKGPQSTHYGNNVVMPNGTYSIVVTVNGKKTEFRMAVSASAMEKMHMH